MNCSKPTGIFSHSSFQDKKMKYLLGVDQGSTHTRALVSDLDGHLLGLGRAEGACHAYVGMQRAMDAIQTAAAEALLNAGLHSQGLQDLESVYAGLTGADWPDEYGLLTENILRLGLAASVHVTNDTIIALRGGTARQYGAILIAGSGGNCAVRAPDGREYIYGYFQEDELQGGAALARHVLRAVYRAYTDRERQTELTGIALKLFGVASVDDLLRADVEQRLPEKLVHALVPRLFEAACEEDWVAMEILRDFGSGCAGLVTAALRRFDMTSLELEVVLSGSVFKGKGPYLQQVIATGIQRYAPRAQLVNARYEPVVGAVLLGLEHIGVEIDDAIRSNIEAGAQALNLIRLNGNQAAEQNSGNAGGTNERN
jgi:N-acetylglucosamine kinase-like BadF-type ATPase